nr:coelomic cytolytic factor-1 [Arenicola marina]
MAMHLLLLTLLIATAQCQLDGWENYQLVWSDDFNGPDIDLTKWQYDITAGGFGNNEFQVYTPDSANSYIQDGALFIKPTRLVDNTNPSTGQPFGDQFLVDGVLNLTALYGDCTLSDWNGCYRVGDDIPPMMSGRLRSYQRFSFTYGRAVIEAKMPLGDWMWPAMWLLPEDYVYGGWPTSGEMDMVEIIGNEDLVFRDSGEYAGIQKMGSTLHWGVDWQQNRYYLTTNHHFNTSMDYSNNFHVYVMDWSPNGLRFYVDDLLILSVPNPQIDQNPSWTGFYDFGAPWNPPPTNPWADGSLMAPFDQNFHFLLNVAVGGTNGFIPDDSQASNRGDQYPKPWNNGMSQKDGMNSFYSAQDDWYWTWTRGDTGTMQVNSVQVYELTP